MDFSKAFDKVGHQRLLYKLAQYGVGGGANAWIQGFLRERSQTVVVEGESSDSIRVESGVPQGSVLGPCLFLYYINDLPEGLRSKVRLFADDTIIYLTITGDDDTARLQHDLDLLAKWELHWQMEFHPDKCQTLSITRRKKPTLHKYTLHGKTLENVTSAKYLGVTITSDLKWDTHISKTVSKANSTLGFLKRNLKVSSPRVKQQAYFSYVRPTLEYASSVWDPYTVKAQHSIEMVQRRAARFALGRYHNISSVSGMLSTLKWHSLLVRRRQARLCMFYKIVHGLVATPIHQFAKPVTRHTRHTNSLAFQIPCSRCDYHKFAFFPRTIRDWNGLPTSLVELPTLNSFRAGLASA